MVNQSKPRRTATRIADVDVMIAGLAFLLGVAVSHPLAVLTLKTLPRFASWSDQAQYLRSASAFAHGSLRQADHWYPTLYAMTLALVGWLPILIGTTIVNLACYCVCFAGYRAVFRRLGLSRVAIVITFLFGTIAYPITGDGWLMPWTTTLSAALIWGALGLVACRIESRARGGASWLLGVVLGLIPLCRPADVAVGLAIFVIALPWFMMRRDWRGFGETIVAGLVTVAAGGLLHVAINGPHLSPYMLLSADYGANFAWLGWKAAIILIDPRPWYPYGDGMLKVMPWLPIGAAGLIIGLIEPRRRSLTFLLAIPAAVALAIMLAYVDFTPSGLWKFGNAHYFKWIVPIFAGFAWMFVRDARRHWALSAIVLLAILVLAAIRVVPVSAAPAEPARLIVFAPVKAPFEGVYFGHSLVRDRLGVQASHYQFRAIPQSPEGRVMIEALRRDFAGDERWIYPPAGNFWPREGKIDDTYTMPGPFSVQPVARYRPGVALGWPCWLPPYACPTTI